MPKLVTLGELRDRVIRRADLDAEISAFQRNEINVELNCAAANLWDLIIQAEPDYYTKEFSYTLVAGTDTYALPDDHYKTRYVDATPPNSTLKYTLHKWQLDDRNLYQRNTIYSWVGCNKILYREMAQNLKFLPVPEAAYTVNLGYIPCFPDMNSDDDTLDSINGYEDIVVLDAIIWAKAKLEIDTSVEMSMREGAVNDIKRAIANRNLAEPERMTITGESDRLDAPHWRHGLFWPRDDYWP